MKHTLTNLWHRLLVKIHPSRCHLLTAQVEDGDSIKTIYRAITEEQAMLLIESAMEAGLPGWAELDDGNLLPFGQPWQDDEEDEDHEALIYLEDLEHEEREALMDELRSLEQGMDEEPDDDDDEWGLFE